MPEPEVQEIIDVLQEVIEDGSVPKNVKQKIENAIKTLSDTTDNISIRVNKVLNDLDEISDDANMQAYTRTQLWNISSMLEKF